MLSLPREEKTTFTVPTFPELSKETEIKDLVSSKSWEFFTILKLPADWLELAPAKWSDNENYLKARKFVQTVKVTNDCAERGIKLATDYAKCLTKDSSMRSKIFQVVEADRRARPDNKKKTMNK